MGREAAYKQLPGGRKTFMPHRGFYGRWDDFMGISMFWTDKFIIIVMYLQRLALMMLWSLNWPLRLYKVMSWVFISLLDLTAHHDSVATIGPKFFEGCETICKIVWPAVVLPVVLLWSVATLLPLPLYYTRNIERFTWTLVRIMFLPFMNSLSRYYILNHKGNLSIKEYKWKSPTSEIGVIMLLITVTAFFGLGYARSRPAVLFKSRIRHEAFLRARELEYKLKFSCMYRNERLWMVSSYNYEAWWWSMVRPASDLIILALLCFAPAKYGICFGTGVLTLKALYAMLYADPYRAVSSSHIELVLDISMAIFSYFGIFQVFGVRYALLVNDDLDYFLLAIHGVAMLIVLLMCVYYFIDGHVFSFMMSPAEQRALKKWKATFLENEEEAKRQARKLGSNVDEYTEDTSSFGGSKESAEPSDGLPDTASSNRFYVPRRGDCIEINTASEHVWPVNNIIINELLHRNTHDHLIDVLRAARKMLDRISALHNTPVLVPLDELKTHMSRLRRCIAMCRRQRITHHSNMIHPLQTTFEDLLEQFTYELRVFSGRSVTQGHNARKMIEVSRFLRVRMSKRDRALALFSPLMRRVLMKLFALRVFIQLVEERPAYLLPKDGKGPLDNRGLGQSSSSSDGEHEMGRDAVKHDVFARVENAVEHFNQRVDAPNDSVEEENVQHQQMLAELLQARANGEDVDPEHAASTSSDDLPANPGYGGSVEDRGGFFEGDGAAEVADSPGQDGGFAPVAEEDGEGPAFADDAEDPDADAYGAGIGSDDEGKYEDENGDYGNRPTDSRE